MKSDDFNPGSSSSSSSRGRSLSRRSDSRRSSNSRSSSRRSSTRRSSDARRSSRRSGTRRSSDTRRSSRKSSTRRSSHTRSSSRRSSTRRSSDARSSSRRSSTRRSSDSRSNTRRSSDSRSSSRRSNTRRSSDTRSSSRRSNTRSLPNTGSSSGTRSKSHGRSLAAKKLILETMNHPWHQHPITPMREGNPFKCSGCKELGFGSRYQCERDSCDFVLHDECAKARRSDLSRKHPFMGDCKFEFLREPPGGPTARICDACGRDVQGFVYHDGSQHKLDLHPCCLNLKSTMCDPHGRMELILKGRVPSKCVKCKSKDIITENNNGSFRGWSYVSSCGNYCYPVYCVKKLIVENWENGYFDVGSSSRRGRILSRSENGSSSTSKSLHSSRSSVTSATSSLALARRSASRPRLTAAMTKVAEVGFSILLSVLFGNPVPMLTPLLQALLD